MWDLSGGGESTREASNVKGGSAGTKETKFSQNAVAPAA